MAVVVFECVSLMSETYWLLAFTAMYCGTGLLDCLGHHPS